MRVPGADIVLANGLKVPAREVPVTVWHDHVVRHALGFDWVTLEPPRPWNHEGWDDLVPQVAAESEHTGLKLWLRNQKQTGRACVQLYAKPKQGCAQCSQVLFRQCTDRLPEVARRYAEVVLATVHALAEGEAFVLTRAEATKRILLRIRDKPDSKPSELVLMSFGDSGNHHAPIAQARRGDGVIVEWYLNGVDEQRFLSFRTAYRERPRQPIWGILMKQYAAPLNRLGALSERVLVSRRLAEVLHV
jgi:hypothetical protein